MKNKTLKENMQRFGTKNLSEQEAVGRSEPISVNIQPGNDLAKKEFIKQVESFLAVSDNLDACQVAWGLKGEAEEYLKREGKYSNKSKFGQACKGSENIR